MKITVTIKEAMNGNLLGGFEKFCEITGLNPWAVNEGLATGDEEYEITTEQAKECGLLPIDRG